MDKSALTRKQRERFDELLEGVLQELPQWVLDLLDEVPLIVEDFPSDELLRELGIEDREELCGLYSGIALNEPEGRRFRHFPDQILIYREGILAAAVDEEGRIRREALRREIRITVLHEIGHHFGLDEDDLRELGYD